MMERVLIIGPCGAGKSALSSALGARLGLPVFHMDKLYWKPGWVGCDRSDLQAMLHGICTTDRWLIDGHYGGTLGERLKRADTVVYLDFPIRLCLWRVLRRIATWHGRPRPDMTEGCPERLDLGFILYLLRWNRGPRQRTEESLRAFKGTLIRIRQPADLALWMGSLLS